MHSETFGSREQACCRCNGVSIWADCILEGLCEMIAEQSVARFEVSNSVDVRHGVGLVPE